MTDCGFYKSKEEAEKEFTEEKKEFTELLLNDTCSFIDMKAAYIDNDNKCPPDCRFYPPRENYK